MDYFLTTYAKDYKWPSVKYKRGDELKEIEEATREDVQKFEGFGKYDEKSKKTFQSDIVPAHQGAPPQGELSKFDQPNTYLRKLYSKYPYLYEIMKITPPEELAKKVYAEKYKTTYQEDYSPRGFLDFKNNVEQLSQDIKKDYLMEGVCGDDTKVAVVHRKDCACEHDEKHHPCKCAEDAHPVKKIAWKPAPISKMQRYPKDKELKKKDEDKEGGEKASSKSPDYKPYLSEYKATISRIGTIIIKKKLLYYQEPEDKCRTSSSFVD